VSSTAPPPPGQGGPCRARARSDPLGHNRAHLGPPARPARTAAQVPRRPVTGRRSHPEDRRDHLHSPSARRLQRPPGIDRTASLPGAALLRLRPRRAGHRHHRRSTSHPATWTPDPRPVPGHRRVPTTAARERETAGRGAHRRRGADHRRHGWCCCSWCTSCTSRTLLGQSRPNATSALNKGVGHRRRGAGATDHFVPRTARHRQVYIRRSATTGTSPSSRHHQPDWRSAPATPHALPGQPGDMAIAGHRVGEGAPSTQLNVVQSCRRDRDRDQSDGTSTGCCDGERGRYWATGRGKTTQCAGPTARARSSR